MPQLSFFRIFFIAIICSLALLFASPNFFYSTVDKKLISSKWSGSVQRDLLKISSLENIITITFSDEQKRTLEKQVIEQSLEIIRRRVDETGTREPTIQRQGRKRVLVQVPGLGSSEELIALLGLSLIHISEPTRQP